jgi:hypothetical protein
MVGILLVVLALGAAVVSVDHAMRRPSTRGARSSRRIDTLPVGTPSEIVGWTSGWNLVTISTRSGAVLHTLATQVGIFAPGLPDVSVAPDGTVFFDSSAASSFDRGDWTGDQIFSVPINGGPIIRVAAGVDPEVSPDGRRLAYVDSDPQGEAPYLSSSGGISIANVVQGGVTDVRTISPGPAQLNQGLSDLSWSADSQDLSFDLLDGSTDGTTSWTLSPGPGVTSLAAAQQIHVQQPGMSWNGYWGRDRHGTPVGLGVLTRESGSQEVVTIDPSTGRVLARLFSLPGVVCVSLPHPSQSACGADFSNAIAGTSTGQSVLIAGVIPIVGGIPTTSGATAVFRWSVGNHAPVRLTAQVLRATWGPPSG